MRCLVFADMHNNVGFVSKYAHLLNKKYDAYFILGDTDYWCMKEIVKYIDTNRTFGILGNHDYPEIYDDFGIQNIHGKVLRIGWVTFTGFQYSEKYSDNSSRLMYTQDESLDVARSLPKADILLSHTSPLLSEPKNEAHTGLIGVNEYIKLNSPKLVIHGHHHKNCDYYIDDTRVIGMYRVKEYEIS